MKRNLIRNMGLQGYPPQSSSYSNAQRHDLEYPQTTLDITLFSFTHVQVELTLLSPDSRVCTLFFPCLLNWLIFRQARLCALFKIVTLLLNFMPLLENTKPLQYWSLWKSFSVNVLNMTLTEKLVNNQYIEKPPLISRAISRAIERRRNALLLDPGHLNAR